VISGTSLPVFRPEVRRLRAADRSPIANPSAIKHHVLVDYDKDKVDEMVLALLFLTLHDDGRAWKGHDWDALDRLHAKGMIRNPVGKAKSVALTEQGEKLCEELFWRHFAAQR
jgi:hypothetical protein